MPPAPRRPDLFIVGSVKAGTTSLYEYLRGHPQVYMSPSKEPRYFAPDLDAGHPHDLHYPADLERYLSLFADAGDAKRVGEASVRYLYSEVAPRLIKEFQPKAYIIAMLRNPVDVLPSLYVQRVGQGQEDITDLRGALAADDDRRAGRRVPAGLHPRLSLYRDQALYGEQLPRWFETFGRERVHVIIFEEFVRQPADSLRAVLQFLEVDPGYQPPSFEAYNASWAPRSSRVQRLATTRAGRWLIWQLMPRLLGEGRERRLVRTIQHSRLYRRRLARDPLDPRLRAQLQAEFAPDVARLSALLGRDMAALWWGQQ